MYITDSNQPEMDGLYFAHTDYQGSLIGLSKDNGSGTYDIVQRSAYDPWGNRRNPANWAEALVDDGSYRFTSRGYTLHEHLDGYGLLNMNGRVYDPMLSRFLSPDPFVQLPGSAMGYNRYTYALNNPLIYSDPTGYTWLGDFFRWVSQFPKWAEETPWFPSSGGVGYGTYGFNYQIGQGKPIYTRKTSDPAQNVNSAINSAQWHDASFRDFKANYDNNVNYSVSKIISDVDQLDVAQNGGGETWYYGVQGTSDVNSHAFAYNPNSGMIYEINHVSADPNVELGFMDKLSGLTGIQNGSVISIGRKYNMNTREGRLSFMNFRYGRPNIRLVPVYIPNPHRSTMFFESFVGRSWHYSLLNKNCKYYIITGLILGGVNNILIQSPLPTVFNGTNIRNLETVQPNW